MYVLILAAAEKASKTPFFIAGGVLAAYAVVLASIGITHPEFPYGKLGQRGVMAISLTIVVVTIAMAVVTS